MLIDENMIKHAYSIINYRFHIKAGLLSPAFLCSQSKKNCNFAA